MSTRATLQFKDDGHTWFVYKHCDGYPSGVQPDLDALLDVHNVDFREMGQIVTMFLMLANKGATDFSGLSYEMTDCQHGDEEYLYVLELKTVPSDKPYPRRELKKLTYTVESI
jgi:hypothetical protein